MGIKKHTQLVHISIVLSLLVLFGFSHKFYVSISQIELNREAKSLEISIRLFAHDLEEAVFRNSKEKLLLGSNKENPKAKELILAYLKSNFEIIQSEKAIAYKLLGFELENDIIWLYVEASYKQIIKDIEISNSLITDLFEDQKNIINFKDKGKTQSQICTKTKPKYSFRTDS